MQTGKMINRISNRLRRRSRAIQESLGITGAQGNILDYIIVESGSHSVYQKEIEEEFPGMDVHMDPLSLSVSCHIGYGALAITCCLVL